MQARAGCDLDPVNTGRNQDCQSTADKARLPGPARTASIHRGLDVTVPFHAQFSKRRPCGVINHHAGNITEGVTRAERLSAPVNVLSDLDTAKWPDILEIRLAHHEVARSAKAVLLNVKLESIGKYAFIGF